MTPEPILHFQSLAVGYNNRPLHKPFSFSVEEGEFVSLIGANGSGKSTLLKTLIKEIPPISGKILLYNRDLQSFSAKELSQKMSALLTVSVKSELLTCREVVAGGRYPYTGHFGLLNDDDRAKIDEVISLVKAESFASQDFMKVSDGQKQRILFARALAQNPKVLVLDEPTSYLDIRWRLEMISVLKDLCRRGVTVIASLHEIDLALRASDRILCVGEGSVTELSREEGGCRAQIQNLYGLENDFFEKEDHYAKLVKNFCRKGESLPPGLSPQAVFGTPPSPGEYPKPPTSIMVQGTMSNAGKSFLVAGLCRIFKQDGYSVAPFKSQNMALNSFITDEGLEMGRAQVMQAEAAGVKPSVLMNPILLKPTSDVGSQVIVNGEVIGNMGAKKYFAFKKSLVPEIKSAYEKLASGHDIIVIEGAGSPAEINLKQNDIVNMGMAELADSPVLLVADIDRGGVFAQLYGTVELLEPNERSRIKGLIINKFRGDKSILDSGIKMLEEKTGIPVVGTLPYMKIQLDDEDSLSENLHTLAKFRDKKDEIQLAIVRLPHISNFTDFILLQNLAAVNSYYAEKPKDLGNPDCIIIPGTKNTLADLQWLKETGFAELIQSEAKKGTPVAGICGGFQILGEKLSGSEVESESPGDCVKAGDSASFVKGLGLLPVETVFCAKKTRTRVSGRILPQPPSSSDTTDLSLSGSTRQSSGTFSCLANLPVSGYEIHMGTTGFTNEAKSILSSEQNFSSSDSVGLPFFARITDSVTGETKLDGAVNKNVFGTYIHGLFDERTFTNQFVKILAKRKEFDLPEGFEKPNESSESQISNGNPQNGTDGKTSGSISEFKESQYNLLAQTLREHLDMKKIYEIMGFAKS